VNSKLIDKIKKMFALANDAGAAKGEAENAMRMANKMMERHNLTSMDLHNKEDITIKFEDGSRYNWIKHLYMAVAEVYSCGFFTQGSDQCLIVGAESDAVTASIVTHGLIDSINKQGKGQGIAFKNGAMFEIARQCREIIRARKDSTEIAPSTGLVLADIYATKHQRSLDFMDKNLNLKQGRRTKMNSNEAGRAYGASLNPHAHLSNKKALN